MKQHYIINRGIIGRCIVTQYDESDPELCAKFWRCGEFQKHCTIYGYDLETITQQARQCLDRWRESEQFYFGG